jgi:hypothetical protein
VVSPVVLLAAAVVLLLPAEGAVLRDVELVGGQQQPQLGVVEVLAAVMVLE